MAQGVASVRCSHKQQCQRQLKGSGRSCYSYRAMAQVLLFITGVLASFIAGYFISRGSRSSTAPSGTGERLLEERLRKADAGLEQFSRQLDAQTEELKTQQKQLQESRSNPFLA